MRIIETRYAPGSRDHNGRDISGTRSAYSGERWGEVFIKGRSHVEDDEKAEEFVRYLHYVDVTEEVEEARAKDKPTSYAPKLGGRLP